MKPKKIDRSTKKWVALYNERIKELYQGVRRISYTNNVMHLIEESEYIKEAEEYADKLYLAMR